jgi:hypothetical protein
MIKEKPNDTEADGEIRRHMRQCDEGESPVELTGESLQTPCVPSPDCLTLDFDSLREDIKMGRTSRRRGPY